MIKVKIIGTDIVLKVDDINAVDLDTNDTFALIVCDGQLITAPKSRVVIVSDIKKGETK